ncbi:hypothetical protein [Bradyrhizobium iriomotense]|uniref:hypothetical protein n=1 Tax=Bradyrhizobium iriomotense TaxID=441950 RepID=UPI001FED7598|nr:hypothetical protein [Bradyrhizobium iriomotense]
MTDAQCRHDLAEQRIARLEASFFRSFRRGSIAASKTELVQLSRRCDEAKTRLIEAETQKRFAEDARDELWLDTEFQLSGPAHAAWQRLSDAFSTLMKSECVWDVKADRSKRSGEERSSATRVVDRRPVSLVRAGLPIIQSKYEALRWQNANGGDLFVYPGFLVVFQDENTFALLDLNEAKTTLVPQKFQETDINPHDAKRVGTAWKYSNRDGTPDRRYTNNSEIPVLLYGEIRWQSDSGLSEAYMFSNAEAAAAFVDQLEEFRRSLPVADPEMDEIFRRVDFQTSNFSKVEGTARWDFDCKFVCRACGGNVIRYDGDNPSDATIVTCKNCGQALGSYGQLMAGAKYVGTQQLPRG